MAYAVTVLEVKDVSVAIAISVFSEEKVLSRDRFADEEVVGESVIVAEVDGDNEVLTLPVDETEYLPVNVMREESDSSTLVERVTTGSDEAVEETVTTEDRVTKLVNVLVCVVCIDIV